MRLLLLFGLASSFSCQPGQGNPPASVPANGQASTAANDLAALSDEFADTGSLASWKRVTQVEGAQVSPLQTFRVEGGRLQLVPVTCTWYKDFRAEMVFKEVEGDFILTTLARCTSRSGSGAPRTAFSLGGLMVRTPRTDTGRNWRPGRENYVFLSLGAADQPGRFQFEVKTTINSDSQLQTSPADGPEAQIRIARLGTHMVMLRKTSSGWIVHKRYDRSDMPKKVQAGVTVYTNYYGTQGMDVVTHNSRFGSAQGADLVATFDYIRYTRPAADLASRAARMSDADLVRALGE